MRYLTILFALLLAPFTAAKAVIETEMELKTHLSQGRPIEATETHVPILIKDMFSAAKPVPPQNAAVVLSKIHPMNITGQKYRFIWSLNDQYFFLRNRGGVFPENGTLEFLVPGSKSMGTPHEYGFTSKEACGSRMLPEVISILAFTAPLPQGAPTAAATTLGSRPVSRPTQQTRVVPADATDAHLYLQRYKPHMPLAPPGCCCLL